MEKRNVTYIVLALLVWAISSTITTGYYFAQYNIYKTEYGNLSREFNTLSSVIGGLSEMMNSISLRANILLSYTNGTKIWHNNTALPIASTAFTAILAVADIRYTDYGGELGILVTSINGVANNSTHGWLY